MIRDRARDEAVAIAKSCSHPQVELRHVLWGLVRALGSEAPAEVTPATIRRLLDPPGTSFATPPVSDLAEEALSAVDSTATARAKVLELARQLDAGAAAPGAGPTHAEASTAVPTTGSATPVGEPQAATAAAGADTKTPAPAETTDSILAELDALVGLGVVKAEVRRLIAVERLNASRREAGLPEVNQGHHVVFTGSPGTGKTTVARLIARLYGSVGVVSRGHLVETSRADLIAGYVGQTAIKVSEVVSRAVGGVLFIDEAYSLAGDDAEDFGREAIATLVKLMEDHRRDLVVIVAGYSDEMRHFIDSNPGLRSRFTRYIHFPDYDPPELVRIFELMAADAKVRLATGVVDRVQELCAAALDVGNFGNARFARNVFEQSYANMAARAIADDTIERAELDELTVADLPPAGSPMTEQRRTIGFRRR